MIEHYIAFASCLVLLFCYVHNSHGDNTGPAYAGHAGYPNRGVVYAPNGAGYRSPDIVNAAIHTRHKIDFVNIPSSGDIKPTLIEIAGNVVPLNIVFRSSSSLLRVQQLHQGATVQEPVQETQSSDEPHVLKHTVLKPIYQSVHEVISPFRKIVQEIQPVSEEIQTIVARAPAGADYKEPEIATTNAGVGTRENVAPTRTVGDAHGNYEPRGYVTSSSSLAASTTKDLGLSARSGVPSMDRALFGPFRSLSMKHSQLHRSPSVTY